MVKGAWDDVRIPSIPEGETVCYVSGDKRPLPYIDPVTGEKHIEDGKGGHKVYIRPLGWPIGTDYAIRVPVTMLAKLAPFAQSGMPCSIVRTGIGRDDTRFLVRPYVAESFNPPDLED